MEIISSLFIRSYARAQDCTLEQKPEVALIGRSNVGKSSLINMLLQRKELAKTSSRPGKTRLLNLFEVNNGSWLLMDMPGYGWAKLAKSDAKRMQTENKTYLLTRKNLVCLLILVDIRHKPLRIDLEFIRWVGEQEIPFGLVFTKADKLSKSQIQLQLTTYNNKLKEEWELLPPTFISSAAKQQGRAEVLSFLEEGIKRFHK